MNQNNEEHKQGKARKEIISTLRDKDNSIIETVLAKVIHHRHTQSQRKLTFVVHGNVSTVDMRHTTTDFFHATLDFLLGFLGEGPASTCDGDMIGDDVVSVATFDGAASQYRAFQWIDISGDYGLQRSH